MGFWEALTKGEGTPWGAMEHGAPSANYIDDPYSSEIHAPDQSALRQAMLSRIGKNAGRAQAGALAGLQKAGVYGADSARAIGRVAEGQTEAQGNLEASLGQQDFDNRLGLMGAINTNRRAKYKADADLYDNEQKGRGDFWNGVTGLAGKATGAYLGGGL